MKDEYDSSGAERGKFFRAGAKFHLPVHLDSENQSFVQDLAQRDNSDVSTVVNQLIRSTRQLAETTE